MSGAVRYSGYKSSKLIKGMKNKRTKQREVVRSKARSLRAEEEKLKKTKQYHQRDDNS